MKNEEATGHPGQRPGTDTGTVSALADAEKALDALRPVLQPLAQRFADHDVALYLVGGSVRDALLGRLGTDLDFTTPARPDLVRKILDGYADTVWDTGIDFGTLSAEKSGKQIEITTFRSDTYDGRSRNPEVSYGDTLDGDLIRRDFRVNAMAVELLPDGSFRFHDPVGGLADLAAGVLDTPATPEQSFNDDPLRMLRAARFVSQLDFRPAERVHSAMSAMAGQIGRITVERVQAELDKMMLGRVPWLGIDLMVDTGIADIIFPEIPALRLTQDEHRQHKDVYAHSLQVLRQVMDREEDGPDLVLRWAALLHDIGKPDTRAFNGDGAVTFHQHEVVGAKLARRRLRALKYPKHVINEVNQLVFLHMRFHGYGESRWTDSAVRRYVTDAGDQLQRLHKLVRADVTTRNRRKAERLARTYDHLEERIAEIGQKEDLARVRPDLDGNEIMKLLDISPGPDVGRAWAFLKELRLERGPLGHDEAVEALLAWWRGQSGGTAAPDTTEDRDNE
ncbi:CCA tRNA nucleotidyltransferase [Corynebacterium sp. P5875]|uniref:CCA tRNA nucleotidyltransferase n=1 Tax=Corynebacterium antarcticum TaxID=2800405 RepID=A0A9Q4CBC9_9CORY|nr:CCA tRNA nucleotidyltransferase [Corynebacterium antarcticum]MCX7537783.1 CCA tRNA nucleotidyltransferase [Corynebacterium antarcticum]